MILINVYNFNVVSIVGYFDCVVNFVSDLRYFYDIVELIYVIKLWDFLVKVVGLWVDEYFYVYVIM